MSKVELCRAFGEGGGGAHDGSDGLFEHLDQDQDGGVSLPEWLSYLKSRSTEQSGGIAWVEELLERLRANLSLRELHSAPRVGRGQPSGTAAEKGLGLGKEGWEAVLGEAERVFHLISGGDARLSKALNRPSSAPQLETLTLRPRWS